MTFEQKLDLIKSYIVELESIEKDPSYSINEKQQFKRALYEYNTLYDDVCKGKLDADTLHENITSYFYYLQ